MLRRCLAVVLPVALAGSYVLVSAPTPARADSLTPSNMSWFHDMLVDEAHHRVFLTGESTSHTGDVVEVRTDAGALEQTWDLPAVGDLALSGDGSRLLMGVGAAIRVLDAGTLALVGEYPTGCNSSVEQMAPSGSKVWYVCSSGLGVMDLSAESPSGTSVLSLNYPYEVQVSPTDPHKLLVRVTYELHLVDVGQSPAAVTASASADVSRRSFVFSADGSYLIGRDSYAGGYPRLSAADLSVLPAFGSGVARTAAVTVSPNGYVAGGVDSGAAATPDIRVYDATGTQLRTYDFGASYPYGRLAPDGLALSADASRLFVVSYDGDVTPRYALRVLDGPTKRVTSMALTAPTGAGIGVSYAVKGAITSASPIPAGQTLTVKRVSGYGTVTRPSVTTSAGGSFTIADAVPYRGWYTYTVSWPGDATHLGVTRSVKAYVKGRATSVSASLSPLTVTYGGYVTVTGHLGTATKVRSLSIYAVRVGSTTVTRLKTATVDSAGNIKGSWKPDQNTWYAVRYLGDSIYEPASAGRTAYVRPQMSVKVSYYSGRSGSTYLFGKYSMPNLGVTLHPVRGGCLKAVQQKYVSGSWRTIDSSGCLPIYSTGTDMRTGYCSINVYDGDPASGSYRVKVSFPATRSMAGASLPYVYYRYLR